MTQVDKDETKPERSEDVEVAQPQAEQKAADVGASDAAPDPELEKPLSVEELQAELARSEAKVAEHYDLYVRAMAELENTRRRSIEEVQKARKYGVEKFAQNLLPVVDSLEKALEAARKEESSPMLDGLETIYRQMIHALDVSGMKPIDPKGEPFNPHQHQAIAMVPAPEGASAGSVVEVFQRGWLIADRVLRPAMVSVAQS